MTAEICRTGRPLCGETFQRRVLFVSAEPVVNALMRELTHMVFGLQRSCEGTIGEHGMETRVKVDMTLPRP
jgi:hypothetical protein